MCWHVDDIKSSHVSKKLQDEFESWLIDTYDKDANRKVVGKQKRCTGKTLDYLGMTISYEGREK